MDALPVFDRFSIWSTSVDLGVTSAAALADARVLLDGVLVEVEQAASRFRPNTEIFDLNASAGTGPFQASPMLFDLVAHGVHAAHVTSGACDPTVADSLIALGYDRDYGALLDEGTIDSTHIRPSPGVSGIVLNADQLTIELPDGVHLDLGATAKARAADIAAEGIHAQLSVGVVVDIGGDLRVAGPAPVDGWMIGIADEPKDAEVRGHDGDTQEVVSISKGALATSSSVVRHWNRSDTRHHHVIDPSTGWSVETPFRMVTISAGTCVEANAFSTAAIVWGEDALFEIPQRSLVARLVRHDGTIERLGGWPLPETEGGIA